jgi:hypothetical protein
MLGSTAARCFILRHSDGGVRPLRRLSTWIVALLRVDAMSYGE